MLHLKLWTSEQFGKLSDKAKLLYVGLITLADDDGRLKGNPAYLRGQIFPYDEKLSVTDVLQLRNEIVLNGLITVYSIDGFEYIEHPKWKDYQVIRKDLYKESQLPSRNKSVTKSLRKSTLSKDKISKDKISSEEGTSHTLIVALIESFKDINPSYKDWYGNKTQRLACKWLIDTYGLEDSQKKVSYLPKLNSTPYAPTTTSPNELKVNMARIKAFIDKEKNITVKNLKPIFI